MILSIEPVGDEDLFSQSEKSSAHPSMAPQDDLFTAASADSSLDSSAAQHPSQDVEHTIFIPKSLLYLYMALLHRQQAKGFSGNPPDGCVCNHRRVAAV